MASLTNVFKKNRPDLSLGSLRTYTSIVKNLGEQMDIPINGPEDIISRYNDIIDHLKDVPAKVRKTRLSALVVFIDQSKSKHTEDAVKAFRQQMTDDGKESDEIDLKQELTDRQKQGMMTWDEVMNRYTRLEQEVLPLMKHNDLDKRSMFKVQLYVLLSCLILIPPRRSLDWCAFKLRDIDADKDNYMVVEKRKPYFVFNTYKTASKHGQQKEEIPKKLHTIMKRWIELNPNSHLIMNTKQTRECNSTQITNMLYSFFDRPTSTSMLRHIYLTNKYKDVPALKEMVDTASSMGHTLDEALKYVKR